MCKAVSASRTASLAAWNALSAYMIESFACSRYALPASLSTTVLRSRSKRRTPRVSSNSCMFLVRWD